MFLISKLVIDKFRIFAQGEEFKICDCVTLISGLNGTAKSTLLGMICQPLGFTTKKTKSVYTRVYDAIEDLGEYRTLFSTQFKAQFSDVFRISSKHDKARDHEYTLYLTGDAFDDVSSVKTDGLSVRSEIRDTKSGGIRFVTNSDVRGAGNGNFPHPVIYMGLERLRPLATAEEKVTASETDLSEDEKLIWNDIYREVMFIHPSERVASEELDTGKGFKKKYQTVKADYFDGESASAGQDNLGQIITAIISFHRLKNSLRESYQGGLILIDEFDVTLHPFAQIALLKKFVQYAKELNVQIIATTHSLIALKSACRELKKDVRLLYLEKSDDKTVKLHNDVDWEYLQERLALITPKSMDRKETITFLFEDSVASTFFKYVTRNVFTKLVRVFNADETNGSAAMSNDVIAKFAARLASKKIPEFESVVYVMDPDSSNLINKRQPRLIVLPGGCAIEKLLYKHLQMKPKGDSFWTKNKTTWDVCFNDYVDIEKDRRYPKECDRSKRYKEWFRSSVVGSGKFGKSGYRVMEDWAQCYPDECKAFCNSVIEALKVANGRLYSLKKRTVDTELAKKFR